VNADELLVTQISLEFQQSPTHHVCVITHMEADVIASDRTARRRTASTSN
jgi:hypothetical protein